MTVPYSVILVPTAKDPRGLLAIGPCGFRPPIAGKWRCCVDGCGNEWWGGKLGYTPTCQGCRRSGSVRGGGVGLVLAYRGEVLDVGTGIAERSGAVVLGWYSTLREWMAGDFRDPNLAVDGEALVIDESGHVVVRETS